MKFVDYVTITVRSGNGGAGSIAFQRDKTGMGGPWGGDGGHGGSVRMTARKNLYTLLDLRYNRHHFAEDGGKGGINNRTGKSAEDITLFVPPGTIAKDRETGARLGEVINDGDVFVLAKGGMGGKGNSFFKSSTQQTPQYAQPGIEGKEKELILELKLLADVGLVGFPNAGKSTLISVVSAAKPKIADYPFTTLAPQLGIVPCTKYRSFSIADIPGIIEGASDGKGLGIQFLKHIERNAVLLYVIPITDEDPVGSFKILSKELEQFNKELLYKPVCIALSKIDLMPKDEVKERVKEVSKELKEFGPVLPISSVAQMGIEDLKSRLLNMVDDNRSE